MLVNDSVVVAAVSYYQSNHNTLCIVRNNETQTLNTTTIYIYILLAASPRRATGLRPIGLSKADTLKNQNFEFHFFFHVTLGMKRYTLAKFHDPMSSNGRDYRENPYNPPPSPF